MLPEQLARAAQARSCLFYHEGNYKQDCSNVLACCSEGTGLVSHSSHFCKRSLTTILPNHIQGCGLRSSVPAPSDTCHPVCQNRSSRSQEMEQSPEETHNRHQITVSDTRTPSCICWYQLNTIALMDSGCAVKMSTKAFLHWFWFSLPCLSPPSF